MSIPVQSPVRRVSSQPQLVLLSTQAAEQLDAVNPMTALGLSRASLTSACPLLA